RLACLELAQRQSRWRERLALRQALPRRTRDVLVWIPFEVVIATSEAAGVHRARWIARCQAAGGCGPTSGTPAFPLPPASWGSAGRDSVRLRTGRGQTATTADRCPRPIALP